MSSEPDIGKVEHGFDFRPLRWNRDQLTYVVAQGERFVTFKLNPYDARDRERSLKQVAKEFPGLGERGVGLEQRIHEWVAEHEKDKAAADSQASTETPTAETDPEKLLKQYDEEVQRKLDAMPEEVRELAERRLRDKNLIGILEDDIGRAGITGERDVAVLAYFVGTSRLLAKPLSLRIQGSSSSGKSHVLASTVLLFPDEATLRATDLTPNALYYLLPGALRHRWVVCGERRRNTDDEVAEATRALRQMQTEGRLDKVVAIKIGGSIQTVRLSQLGPIAFAETTTLLEVFDEDANRCIQVCTDESREQTERVLVLLGRQAAGDVPPDQAGRVQLVHQAMQRMLRRCTVLIPFAPELLRALPMQRPEVRRVAGQVLALIQASALLHQRQRRGFEDRHGTTIQATLEDYAIARQLLLKPLHRSLGGGLPDGTLSFLEWLKTARRPGTEFQKAEIIGLEGSRWNKSQTYEHLRQLESKGLLVVVEGEGKKRGAMYTLIAELPEAGAGGADWLPRVRDGRLVSSVEAVPAPGEARYDDIDF